MTITTRSGKGSALTNSELDADFTHLGGDGSYQAPSTKGTAGQVLRMNSGATALEFGTVSGGGGGGGGSTGTDYNDDVKVRFGTSNDLEIYHDGTANHSYIKETNSSGHLIIQGQEIQFKNAAGTAIMDLNSAQVELRHSGNKKMETNSAVIPTVGPVNVNGAYTLPTSDGTNGQVLTTNGSGAVTFANASGGNPDLYRDNASSATTPSAAGTNAVAIGSGSSAGQTDSIAIGGTAYVGNSYAVALGYDARVSGGDGGTALGRNARASGADSVAVGKSYSSGDGSFAAAIANNTSSYGATGANSIAIGDRAKSTQYRSIAVGLLTQATGDRSTAIGVQTQATANYATAIGMNTYANGTNSVSLGAYNYAKQYGSISIGMYSKSDQRHKLAFAGGGFNMSAGSAQQGLFILRSDTTDATPEALTTNGSAASTDNQIVLSNNSAYGFTGTVIAREDSSSTNDFAVWEIKGGAVRAGSASTTALGSYNINRISESAGATNWSIALSADTTNGAVAITVTGKASHSIRWVATVNTTGVIY